MYKEKWIVPSEKIKNCKDKDNLVCLLGDGDTPEIAIYCEKTGEYYWHIRAENADGVIFRSVDAYLDDLKSAVEDMVYSLRNSYFINEGDESDQDYFCINPLCANYGQVFTPIKNEFGEIVCPECGDPVVTADDFEANDKTEIDYKEIAIILMAFIINNSVVWNYTIKEIVEEIYEYGVTEEELKTLLNDVEDMTSY